MTEPTVEDLIWVRVNGELQQVRRRMTVDSTAIELHGQWYEIAGHPLVGITDVLINTDES